MPDSDPHHDDYLFELARTAQATAIVSRRRKLARRARQADHARQPRDENQANRACPKHNTDLSPTQRRGLRGESQAERYLISQGMTILARNLHCRTGEIDLVATDGRTLAFVEVRVRRSASYGGAAASVTVRKQQRLRRTADYFLPRLCSAYFDGQMPPCRFDVVSIENGTLHWIQHAFEQVMP